jgi:hypothetical protein
MKYRQQGKNVTVLEMAKIQNLYFDKNLPVSKIIKLTGISESAINRCLSNYKNGIIEIPQNKSVVLPNTHAMTFNEILTPILDFYHKNKKRIIKKEIFNYCKENHPEINLSIKTFSKHLSILNTALYNNNEKYLPLIHFPYEAQLDFGACYIYENKVMVRKMFLVLSFPCSQCAYCQIMKTRNAQEFLYSLTKILEHIGGVPKEIWLDNDGLFCSIIGTKRYLNNLFDMYVKHYGFTPKFCSIRKGNEKGNVENAVKNIRLDLLVPVPKVMQYSVYNENLLRLCDKRNSDLSGINITENRLKILKQNVNESFLPLKPPISLNEHTTVKPNEIARLTINNRYYYLPLKYANPKTKGYFPQIYNATIFRDFICIYDSDKKQIAKFKRLGDEDYHSNIDNWGEYLKCFANHMEYVFSTPFFESLPQYIKEHYVFMNYFDRYNLLKNMSCIYEKTKDLTLTFKITCLCIAGNKKERHDYIMTIHHLKNNINFSWV